MKSGDFGFRLAWLTLLSTHVQRKAGWFVTGLEKVGETAKKMAPSTIGRQSGPASKRRGWQLEFAAAAGSNVASVDGTS